MLRGSVSIIAMPIAILGLATSSFGQTVGPDIIDGELWGTVYNWGESEEITGYSVGGIACNMGSSEVSWFATSNQHPVQATQLYRLKAGRFEQIGLAWGWHEYFALAFDDCSLGCITPDPYTGLTLGVGCSNPEGASTTGKQAKLGPRGHVNAFTGYFPYPFTLVPYPPPGTVEVHIGRRLQVHNTDLDPIANPGASYFLEIQYIAADDASAGNGNNNVSYRPVTVSTLSGAYNLVLTGTTVRQTPAIHAWKTADSSVQETVIQVPGEGRFILAAKTTALGGGVWHYEYALYNMNSDRSGRSLFVPIPASTTVSSIGFHDVDYHSGDSDPHAPGTIRGTDWPTTRTSDGLTWETDAWDPLDRQANALRWGTVYNFRFDANQSPATGVLVLGLYKPGTPASVWATAPVPAQSGGACCLQDASCLPNTTAAACALLGGTWQGTGSVCSPNPCVPPPTGACCDLTWGTCAELTQQACANAGGTYQGDWTTCNPNNCPQPATGACCNIGLGTCTITIQAACVGPTSAYQGDGTSCEPNPCVGACCLPDLTTCMAHLTASACAGLNGAWHGVGSLCADVDCTDPPIPTVSEWGNAALGLLLLLAASLLFRRWAPPTAAE